MAPMRPQKRSRADTETDSILNTTETLERPAASVQRSRVSASAYGLVATSLTSCQSKRPRYSASDDNEDFGSSDIDMGTSEGPIVPVMTQLAIDDEADQQYQAADDLYATQAVERQMKKNRNQKNTPAENGIIEEIRCTNFMCHEQLTVTLGPLINFIIGHNGSGKSAVLTALTLCLGGKATSTNRGQNLKSFIKEGREFVFPP